MAFIKCKMCGGDLNIIEGVSTAECEFCGTKQTLPKVNDEVIRNLFNRANALRLKCEFDKAEQVYEKILQENNTEAEAHWGIVLCKYGIEYVEDPKTYKRIPTCHRTSYDAVLADADYLTAVEYADASQRSIYEAEAKTIDGIQKNILSIVKEEKPFDVFLCYKETDENGKRTVDSAIANDIYHQLTQEGLKVFYAAITLEDKLGQAYEPYIFAALNSSKVMLVIGSKPQYFTAVWVKNEWSRFLKLMKSDRTKLLIPCYKDMDAYELPEEFSHLQAQDMSKIGFINDVVRGIRKVTAKNEPEAPVVKETILTGATNVAPLLKRAFMFLEDGEWEKADDFCEQVLNQNPENAMAYVGKLMAKLQVNTQEQLKDCAKSFEENNDYQKAIRFGDDKLKEELSGYITHIKIRNENARKDNIYAGAVAKRDGNTISDCEAAIEMFQSISGWKDADAQIKICREIIIQLQEQAENARKDNIYAGAIAALKYNSVFKCESAIEMFRSISGWKDADEQIIAVQRKIEELKAKQEAERLERERKVENDRKEAERIAKKNKINAIIIASFACAVIAFIILFNYVILPYSKYNDAIALMNDGKYKEAIAAFEALKGFKDSTAKITECKYNEAITLLNAGNVIEAYEAMAALDGYKDSAHQADSIYDAYMVEKLYNAKVGDYVFLGEYEQDNNISNGKEKIEWLVLEAKDGKVLVISKYALDCQPYNTNRVEVTWEICSLREWLNNDFINTAFSTDEKAMIPVSTVLPGKNSEQRTNPGDETLDQVFLLSMDEVNRYFSSDDERVCKPTAYARAQGCWTYDDTSSSHHGSCWWWLRSPGMNSRYAAYVNALGCVDDYGRGVDFSDGVVRPAMWIDLNS